MKDIKVVIGKNFGDEGKGQAVSDLCKGQAALVVRHNGGAQAGHTVEEGDFRFVFHQLGSGSLWGCPTYWSRTFLPDLLKLDEEAEGLRAERLEAVTEGRDALSMEADAEGQDASSMEAVAESLKTNADGAATENNIIIYAHPDCVCTVIYDILLNSLTEQLRGEKRHGSCGMGIYEAVLRSREPAYRLQLRDFACDKSEIVENIAAKLSKIRQEYTMPRLRQLREEYPDGWDNPEIEEWVSLIEDDNLLWNAAEEMCANFAKYVRLTELSALWNKYDRIVFENAQGLMLDEDNMEYYPHLTPSHTGLYNVVRLLSELWGREARDGQNAACDKQKDIADLSDGVEIIYVTRTYVTRHGAGRLDHECTKDAINSKIEDRTNIPNPWQNSLRFAKHPAGELFFRQILVDIKQIKQLYLPDKVPYTVTLRLTHLDETDGKVIFADEEMKVEEFEEFCGSKGILVSGYVRSV